MKVACWTVEVNLGDTDCYTVDLVDEFDWMFVNVLWSGWCSIMVDIMEHRRSNIMALVLGGNVTC